MDAAPSDSLARGDGATGPDAAPSDVPDRTDGAAGPDGATPSDPRGPRLFFSDLLSGPNTGGQSGMGAFVTVYGRGLGASRGASYVTVGGGMARGYPVWSTDHVAIQLGPDARTGEIVVHLESGGTSNGLPFTVRPGTIRFAAPTGSDAADGSFATPWATLAYAKRQLRPGDVLYAMDGLRAATLDGANAALCISASFGCGAQAGTADAPIALVGYPGAVVTVGCASAGCPRDALRVLENNWTVAGLHIETGGETYASGVDMETDALLAATASSHGQRLVANVITSQYYGVVIEQGGDCQVLGNEVLHTPNSAIYMGGYGPNANIEVAWNHVHDLPGAGFGIKAYGHLATDSMTGLSVHHNWIENTQRAGILVGGSDGGAAWIRDARIFDNVLRHVASPGEGAIRIGNAGANETLLDVAILHNTVVDCAASIEVDAAARARVQDNLFVQSSGAYRGFALGAAALVMDHNGYFGGTPVPSEDTMPIVGDPLFVDRAGGDLHLGARSPAIDTGAATDVMVDFDGVRRPQGPGPDLGAFERVP